MRIPGQNSKPELGTKLNKVRTPAQSDLRACVSCEKKISYCTWQRPNQIGWSVCTIPWSTVFQSNEHVGKQKETITAHIGPFESAALRLAERERWRRRRYGNNLRAIIGVLTTRIGTASNFRLLVVRGG